LSYKVQTEHQMAEHTGSHTKWSCVSSGFNQPRTLGFTLF